MIGYERIGLVFCNAGVLSLNYAMVLSFPSSLLLLLLLLFIIIIIVLYCIASTFGITSVIPVGFKEKLSLKKIKRKKRKDNLIEKGKVNGTTRTTNINIYIV